MILQIGDMVRVECTDIVTTHGWNESARTEPIFVYGIIKTFPVPKSLKPELEIVGMHDKAIHNTNHSTALPISLIVRIHKLQCCRGLGELP